MEGLKKRDNTYLPMIMWAVLVTFYVYQFVARSAFPTVLTEEYMRFFSLDAKGVGALVSCYYFVYTFVQIPVGIIIDKYSVRFIASVTAAICAVGVILFVSTQNYYIAGFGQMLVGFGSAFAFISVFKIITNWFPKEKNAIMTSFTVSIGCLGPVFGGPGVAIIVRHFDWRNVILIFGFIGLALAVIIWLVVKDKEKQEEEKKEEIPILDALKMILTSTQLWGIALYSMALYAPLSALGDLWGTAFLKKLYNTNSATASLANNMIYIGVVLGCPFFAYMTNVFNSFKKPMLFAVSMGAVTFGIILFLEGIPLSMMFVLLFIVGFSCGAILGYSFSALLFPKAIIGTVSGFINMASMVSGVILMPLIGYLMDLSWDGTIENGIKVYRACDFQVGFISVLITLVLGVVFALLLKDKSPKGIE